MTRLKTQLIVIVCALIAVFGLKAQVNTLPIQRMGKVDYYVYEVKSKETVYGISKKLGITVDQLTMYNPTSVEGIRVGQKLVFPIADFVELKNGYVYHKLMSGETFFSLSKMYNTTVASIEELNPTLNVTTIPVGTIIKIKKDSNLNQPIEKPVSNNSTQVVAQKSEQPATTLNVIPTETLNDKPIFTATNDTKNEITMAVLLPFNLASEKATKTSNGYIEYYKGILLAVDSIKNQTNKKINVLTFDTEGNDDKVKELIDEGKLAKANFIFAPDSQNQLDMLAQYGKEHNIYVVNNFVVKNDLYLSNPFVVQVNVPQATMLKKVSATLKQTLGDYEIFYLNQSGTSGKELVAMVQQYVADNKVATQTMTFTSSPDYEKLSEMLKPAHKYLFVLNNAKAFDKVKETLKKLKSMRYDIEIALLGYPEWITFKNDAKNDLKTIDTYVYSRFYNDNTSLDYANYYNKFNRIYGISMVKAYPNQGVYGFETSYYFLQRFANSNGTLEAPLANYYGMQHDFIFESAGEGGGFVNTGVNIIHFANGLILKYSK